MHNGFSAKMIKVSNVLRIKNAFPRLKNQNKVSFQNLSTVYCVRYASTLSQFHGAWPEVKQDFLEIIQKNDYQGIATKAFDRALEYRHNKAKLYRGELTVEAFKTFSRDLTDEKIRLASVLGWCVESCMSANIILDDMQDDAVTRYGEATWCKQTSISTASNDATMLFLGIQNVLNKHFVNEQCYTDVLEVFNNATMWLLAGQTLDIEASKMNILDFTMDFYDIIVRNKSTVMVALLPVGAAWQMAGKKNPELWRQIEEALLKIGKFFQIKNDYEDVFVSSELTGKVGTDIQDNKCTWLAVMANKRASSQQKVVLKECYGSTDLEKVERVKQIFYQLELAKAYDEYNHKFNAESNVLFESLPSVVSNFLVKLINTISKDKTLAST